MQIGTTPAHIASRKGHTETLALLLANKADINAAMKVQQLKIFNSLLLIETNFMILTLLFSYYQRF